MKCFRGLFCIALRNSRAIDALASTVRLGADRAINNINSFRNSGCVRRKCY
ncbi:MAG: hypothetical protein LBR67_10815 [Dysgonamonadaceae bacterium]|nr:hypothetical protein [Dysgonamonadaceae bacterium]